MTPRELKPCPCCGNEAERRSDGDCEDYPYWIVCSVCTIQTGPFGDMEFAEQEWNTRAALPEQPLAEKYRKVWEQYADGGFWDEQGVDRVLRKNIRHLLSDVIADLDARHDEGQELLREACAALEVEDEHSDSPMKRIHGDLIARIRKHLKEPSDEA